MVTWKHKSEGFQQTKSAYVRMLPKKPNQGIMYQNQYSEMYLQCCYLRNTNQEATNKPSQHMLKEEKVKDIFDKKSIVWSLLK